jgi:hypothetical protein
MKLKVSDAPATRDTNIIHVPVDMHAAFARTSTFQWDFLFEQFRRNLAGRIPGCTLDRDLVKVQGNMEYINEIEKFFKDVSSSPAGDN